MPSSIPPAPERQSPQPAAANVRWLPVLIWFILPALGLLAAVLLVLRVMAPHAQSLPEPDAGPALARLRTSLAGETLIVPEGSGFWLRRMQQSTVLINQGLPVGMPQTIDLCSQRTLSRADPLAIFAIHLAGDWQDLVQQAGQARSHRPLVLPAALKSGLPRLAIRGRASDEWAQSTLAFHLGPQTRDWVLVSDAAPASAQSAGAQSIAFGQHAWLLWRTPAAAVADEARFAHALHFQRTPALPGSACQAGNLVVTLHDTAAGANLANPAANPAANSSARQPRGLNVAVAVFPDAGGMLASRLPVGRHHFATAAEPQPEDQALFESALAHGLLRLNPHGRIDVAAPDLLQARRAGINVPGWQHITAKDAAQKDLVRLLKRLHTRRDGDYVRAQIRRFNTEDVWAALSIHINPAQAPWLATLADARQWQASVDGQSVALQTGLPDVAARLFDAPLLGWSPWLRAAMPLREQATREVRLRLSLPPLLPGTSAARLAPTQDNAFDLLTLGKISVIKGAAMSEATDMCQGPACATPDVVQRVRITPLPGASEVVFALQPEARFNDLHPAAQAFRHIRRQGPTLAWVNAPAPMATPAAHAQVRLLARDGSVLYEDGKPGAQAQQLGLQTLVGISAAHSNSVAGVLARLGQHGQARVEARTTLEPRMQALANAILDCDGMQGGKWQSRTARCDNAQAVPFDSARRTAMVVMDADNGDVLALADGAAHKLADYANDGAATALIQFDRFNPGHSLLRLHALQHDGGSESNPGSSFKLVTSLGLELAATGSSELNSLLDGTSPAQIDQIAQRQEMAYRMDSACYPQPCSGKATDIVNFRQHLPKDFVNPQGRFGLAESLSTSINTWFSWLTEMTDRTAAAGVIAAAPLATSALDPARPVWAMAHKLGFEKSIHLDAGLLPPDFNWQTWDALRATPSSFDFVQDKPQVRWYGIGSRMQVTPLQMAMVAASIGSGKVVQPRLLLALNGKQAETAPGEALGVRLDRVRAGMKAVTETGTAKSAFASEELKPIRGGVYGKTGTIPRGQGVDRKVNTGWFVGYVEPGTIKGERRRLAFAVFVSRTHETGGTSAARVVADWVGALMQNNGSD